MENKYTYEDFCEFLLQEVNENLPSGYLVEKHDVVKNNGIHLESLTICGAGQTVSPNFYLEMLYEQYQQGTDTSRLAREIVDLYEHFEQDCGEMEIDFTYENCREKIVLRLASGVWNKEILDTVPHIPFLDMVILFYVVLRLDENGVGSVRVSNQMQEQWNLSTQALFVKALENSQRLFPEKTDSLVSVLKERTSIGEQGDFAGFIDEEYEQAEKDGPLVITNHFGINGATVILYPHVLHQIGEKIGRDYYLLPSSIHEFLAVASNPALSGEDLMFMVREVNSNCVAREELLSENVYYYDIQAGRVSVWQKWA